MPICCTRAAILSFMVPGMARPAMSPFTSAITTGTPMREKPSAITISVTDLPVPVAPATRPWRLPYLPSRCTGRSPLPIRRSLIRVGLRWGLARFYPQPAPCRHRIRAARLRA